MEKAKNNLIDQFLGYFSGIRMPQIKFTEKNGQKFWWFRKVHYLCNAIAREHC